MVTYLLFFLLHVNTTHSRDRNREHAKFTRLRKKAYVGKLKDLLDEMKKITDAEEADRRSLGEKIHQTVFILENKVR